MSDTISIGSLAVAHVAPPPGAPTRPAILYVPGYFAGAWIFDRYLAFLAARGYPGYAVNLRGRGGSALRSGTLLGQVRMADFIDDAREVARWLEARGGRPIVIGHSMGGLIAQKVAEEGLARALVLLSSAPPRGISVLSAALVRRQLRYLPALLRSKRVVPRFADIAALVLNRVPEGERRAIFDRLVPDSGRAGREMSLGAVRVRAEAMREHGCPVLVVSADDDRFVPRRIAERLAARYRAPLFVAREHGHLFIQESGWEETASFIADWLAREV